MEMLSLRQFKTWSCPGLSRLTDASAIDSCFSFPRHSSRSVFTPLELTAIQLFPHATADIAGGEKTQAQGKRSTHEVAGAVVARMILRDFPLASRPPVLMQSINGRGTVTDTGKRSPRGQKSSGIVAPLHLSIHSLPRGGGVPATLSLWKSTSLPSFVRGDSLS